MATQTWKTGQSGDITQGTNYNSGVAPVSGDTAVIGSGSATLTQTVTGITYAFPDAALTRVFVNGGTFGTGSVVNATGTMDQTNFQFAGPAAITGLFNVGQIAASGNVLFNVNRLVGPSSTLASTLVLGGTITETTAVGGMATFLQIDDSPITGNLDSTVVNLGLIQVNSGKLSIGLGAASNSGTTHLPGGVFVNTGSIIVANALSGSTSFQVNQENATGVPSTFVNNGLISLTSTTGLGAGTFGVDPSIDTFGVVLGGTGVFSLNGGGNTSANSNVFQFTQAVIGQTLNLTDATFQFLNGYTATNINFLDARGSIQLVGGIAAHTATGTISGFQLGDVIDLGSNGFDTVNGSGSLAPSFSGGTLTLYKNGTASAALTFAGAYTSSSFALVNNPGMANDQLLVACYVSGTAILTDCGERAIETLVAGDRVVTALGGLSRVRWVGRRTIELARHRTPLTIAPIRVLAGALGASTPHRDLSVSPEHLMWIDGALVPAGLLVNGTTIVRDRSVRAVTYVHIELDRHDLLIAEGALSESWLDTGNRAAFENAPVAALVATFQPTEPQRACGPVVTGGTQLKAIRDRLNGCLDTGNGHRDPHRIAG